MQINTKANGPDRVHGPVRKYQPTAMYGIIMQSRVTFISNPSPFILIVFEPGGMSIKGSTLKVDIYNEARRKEAERIVGHLGIDLPNTGNVARDLELLKEALPDAALPYTVECRESRMMVGKWFVTGLIANREEVVARSEQKVADPHAPWNGRKVKVDVSRAPSMSRSPMEIAMASAQAEEVSKERPGASPLPFQQRKNNGIEKELKERLNGTPAPKESTSQSALVAKLQQRLAEAEANAKAAEEEVKRLEEAAASKPTYADELLAWLEGVHSP